MHCTTMRLAQLILKSWGMIARSGGKESWQQWDVWALHHSARYLQQRHLH